jgi:hypothetical protein
MCAIPERRIARPPPGTYEQVTLDRVSAGRVSSAKNTQKREVNHELAKQLFSRHPLLRVTIPKRFRTILMKELRRWLQKQHPVRRPMRLLAASLGI